MSLKPRKSKAAAAKNGAAAEDANRKDERSGEARSDVAAGLGEEGKWGEEGRMHNRKAEARAGSLGGKCIAEMGKEESREKGNADEVRRPCVCLYVRVRVRVHVYRQYAEQHTCAHTRALTHTSTRTHTDTHIQAAKREAASATVARGGHVTGHVTGHTRHNSSVPYESYDASWVEFG